MRMIVHLGTDALHATLEWAIVHNQQWLIVSILLEIMGDGNHFSLDGGNNSNADANHYLSDGGNNSDAGCMNESDGDSNDSGEHSNDESYFVLICNLSLLP